VSNDAHQRLMRRFVDALSTGNFAGMNSMLAESAQLVGDGGGFVSSFPKPLVGGKRIAQLFYAPHLRRKAEMRIELVLINGRSGVLRYFGDELESAQSYDTDGERIVRVYVQRNPEKLRRIVANRVFALR
ncbi:MAG: RNA polymerase subunit sigma-24, partial [Rhodanobacteraceae bacterium]